MLINRKRISVEETPVNLIRIILSARNYIVRTISPEIAELAVRLEKEINNDPADSLIVATAIAENFPLVTADSNLRKAQAISTIW